MDRDTARRLLEAEREEAEAVVASQRRLLTQSPDEIFDQTASVDQHQADAGTETYEREKALTILRLAEDRQADVARALEKVASGTFGYCETCGRRISDERLEARPDARFCADDERDWEFGRIGMIVSEVAPSAPQPPEPGWLELDLLPDDDIVSGRPHLSAEEEALHLDPADGWADADELEASLVEERELDTRE
jgi:RNA polymerase-binding transcription factor DksA